jgi:hypothetical protein
MSDLESYPMRPTTFIEVLACFYSFSYYCIFLEKHEPFAQSGADKITGAVKVNTDTPEHTRSSPSTEETRLR